MDKSSGVNSGVTQFVDGSPDPLYSLIYCGLVENKDQKLSVNGRVISIQESGLFNSISRTFSGDSRHNILNLEPSIDRCIQIFPPKSANLVTIYIWALEGLLRLREMYKLDGIAKDTYEKNIVKLVKSLLENGIWNKKKGSEKQEKHEFCSYNILGNERVSECYKNTFKEFKILDVKLDSPDSNFKLIEEDIRTHLLRQWENSRIQKIALEINNIFQKRNELETQKKKDETNSTDQQKNEPKKSEQVLETPEQLLTKWRLSIIKEIDTCPKVFENIISDVIVKENQRLKEIYEKELKLKLEKEKLEKEKLENEKIEKAKQEQIEKEKKAKELEEQQEKEKQEALEKAKREEQETLEKLKKVQVGQNVNQTTTGLDKK